MKLAGHFCASMIHEKCDYYLVDEPTELDAASGGCRRRNESAFRLPQILIAALSKEQHGVSLASGAVAVAGTGNGLSLTPSQRRSLRATASPLQNGTQKTD
ncbi:hypothetical protein M569_10460 [Genlisea aurea]|uniref:Uncharacterized protein n=1 Tax=Genlisea aurea TaxID=192259 RepID=S8DWL4_9LAMI|nr:hypothetical protein M569_10460 [Genlisea aurea]